MNTRQIHGDQPKNANNSSVRYISAQPAIDLYVWQTEVYIYNFKSVGIQESQIDVVCGFTDEIPQKWIDLQCAFPGVRFSFYRDTDPLRKYLPAIQPHIMKKHFQRYPELKDEPIFYHDCDFVFTRPFDFGPFLNDSLWYFSNTTSYMGARYIESKGYHKTKTSNDGKPISLLDDMARVLGMCSCLARAHEKETGGAQKLMKNLTAEYWDRVEKGSKDLYDFLIAHKDEYGPGEKNDIQVWTASMWAELWTAWLMGVFVKTPPEFDFAWATDPIERWEMHSFFHNAGVVDSENGLFFKGAYSKRLPYGDVLDVDTKRCSSMYYKMIQNVAKESVLL